MKSQEKLAEKQIRIKCAIRTYKDAPTQIFGVVVEGTEYLTMEEASTTMIVADLLVLDGIKVVDTETFSNDGLSREEIMSKFI